MPCWAEVLVCAGRWELVQLSAWPHIDGGKSTVLVWCVEITRDRDVFPEEFLVSLDGQLGYGVGVVEAY